MLKIKDFKSFSFISDVESCNPHSRQNIKMKFLQRDNLQMSNCIKNLEKTIAINKEIIEKLVTDSKQEGLSKKIIILLNKENSILQSELKASISQRDSAQSKLLIVEQILADSKGNEMNYQETMDEKNKELINQLDRKEYLIQDIQSKLLRAVSILSKYSKKDRDAKHFICSINLDASDARNISNVVEENANLITEIHTSRIKMAELQSKLDILTKQGIGESFIEKKNDKSISMNNKSDNSIFTKDYFTLRKNNNEKLEATIKSLKEENEKIKKELLDLKRTQRDKGSELIINKNGVDYFDVISSVRANEIEELFSNK